MSRSWASADWADESGTVNREVAFVSAKVNKCHAVPQLVHEYTLHRGSKVPDSAMLPTLRNIWPTGSSPLCIASASGTGKRGEFAAKVHCFGHILV
jgi:hypothetical protein